MSVVLRAWADGAGRVGAILKDRSLDQKVAQQVIALTRTPAPELAEVGHPSGFERDVHSWNPSQPMWWRSPKD